MLGDGVATRGRNVRNRGCGLHHGGGDHLRERGHIQLVQYLRVTFQSFRRQLHTPELPSLARWVRSMVFSDLGGSIGRATHRRRPCATQALVNFVRIDRLSIADKTFVLPGARMFASPSRIPAFGQRFAFGISTIHSSIQPTPHHHGIATLHLSRVDSSVTLALPLQRAPND